MRRRNPLLPLDPIAGREGDNTFASNAVLKTSREDMALIRQLVERCVKVAIERKVLIPSTMQLGLDWTVVHARRPLNLAALLRLATDDDLYHEMLKVSQNVDRINGMLRSGYESKYFADRMAA